MAALQTREKQLIVNGSFKIWFQFETVPVKIDRSSEYLQIFLGILGGCLPTLRLFAPTRSTLWWAHYQKRMIVLHVCICLKLRGLTDIHVTGDPFRLLDREWGDMWENQRLRDLGIDFGSIIVVDQLCKLVRNTGKKMVSFVHV